jgi:hypothetical protein
VNRPPAAVRLASAGRTSRLARLSLVVILCGPAAGCGPAASSPASTLIAGPPSSAARASPSSAAQASPPSAVEVSPAQPPVARLTVAPAPGTAGALGSYTWLGSGSDSPWLPGAPVSLPRGRTAAVTFEPPVPVVSWRARRATAAGDAPGLVAQGGAGSIEFVVPDSATTIELAVDYGPAGSVTWYWAVTPVP